MEKESLKFRLATALRQSNYDTPALAKQLGISQKLLESYAKGEKLPSIAVFANICKILNLDANAIIQK